MGSARIQTVWPFKLRAVGNLFLYYTSMYFHVLFVWLSCQQRAGHIITVILENSILLCCRGFTMFCGNCVVLCPAGRCAEVHSCSSNEEVWHWWRGTGAQGDVTSTQKEQCQTCQCCLLTTALPLLVLLLPQVVKRGMAPGGGGEVVFTCPVRRTIRPVQLTEPGKIKRIRGVAYPSQSCVLFF